MQLQTICLYSSVSDTDLFSRVGFYRDDLLALSSRCSTVNATNSLWDIVKIRPNLVVGYFYSKALLAVFIGRIIGQKLSLPVEQTRYHPSYTKGSGYISIGVWHFSVCCSLMKCYFPVLMISIISEKSLSAFLACREKLNMLHMWYSRALLKIRRENPSQGNFTLLPSAGWEASIMC